jgi:RNA polymerase sigma-70 factor (ECF subfamily)
METPQQHIQSDEQLLQSLQQDSRQAFNELYFRHWEDLYRAAYTVLRDEDSAKDIVQEVFFSIWKKRHTQQIRQLSAYLFQAVKFQVARQLRHGKLLDIHVEQLGHLHAMNTTEESLHASELDALLETTLGKLPERCRDVFYLSRFEQLSNKEIAQRLNLSTRTVEWHISNALKHLRHSIENTFLLLILFMLH